MELDWVLKLGGLAGIVAIMVPGLKVVNRIIDMKMGKDTNGIDPVVTGHLESIAKHQKESFYILKSMSPKIRDLHEWHDHDVPDQPGQKIWWSKGKAIYDTLSGVKRLVRGQRAVMTKLDIPREAQDE